MKSINEEVVAGNIKLSYLVSSCIQSLSSVFYEAGMEEILGILKPKVQPRTRKPSPKPVAAAPKPAPAPEPAPAPSVLIIKGNKSQSEEVAPE